VNSTK